MFGTDLVTLIETAGYIGLFGIIFAESGLFFGFFLPGDSLLFTAGFLSSQGFLNIFILVPMLFIAAVLGDNVGYAFGYKIGPAIFSKKNRFISEENIKKTERYYEKYGGKTIVIARFVPVVRTFAPIMAGVAKMNYQRFVFFNIIGALLWAVGVTVLGYFLGSVIPNIDKYLAPIIIAIISTSFIPVFWEMYKANRNRSKQ